MLMGLCRPDHEREGRVGPCVGDKRHCVGTGSIGFEVRSMQEAKWFLDFCLEHLGRGLVGQEIELDFTCFKFDVFCFTHTFQ